MDHELRTRILNLIQKECAEGVDPDPEDLKRRHPGHEDAIDLLVSAVEQYRSLETLFHEHSEDDHTLDPGERLGDFEVEAPLARGGMGQVYRARQISLGRRIVALKVLPADRWATHSRERFRQEASLLANLHHEHLAEVYGFGDESGLLFYAMRLVDGPTLEDALHVLLRLRGQDEIHRARRAVVHWAAQVAQALAVVHDAGLVHRDVKPANIILEGAGLDELWTKQGTAILVDFGLAHPLGENEGPIAGAAATLHYAPSEQLLHRGVTPRSDIFALGASLHDLCVPRLPDQRLQAAAGLESLRELDPAIDTDLAAIVAKAADVEPEWRYPDSRTLFRDLQAWLEGRPVAARTRGMAERARTLVHRHRAGIRLVFGAMALLAVAWIITLQRSAKTLRSAVEEGDISAAMSAASRIPGPVHGIFLHDPELRDIASRAQAGLETDPVVRIHDALLRGRPELSLEIAAAHLEDAGLGREPRIIERHLLAGLQSDDFGSTGHIRAVQLTGQLFFMNPALDSRAMENCALFRECLLDTLAQPLVHGLHPAVAQALSGCARANDAKRLLEWALDQPLHGEAQRIGLQASERIVRRAHALDRIADLDLPDLWERIQPLAVDAYDDAMFARDTAPFWNVRACDDLVKALLLAGRAGDYRCDPSALFPQETVEELLADPSRSSCLRQVLAAAGDPRVAMVFDTPGVVGGTLSSHDAGWMCGALGDPQVEAEVKAQLEIRGESALEAFGFGLYLGQCARNGERPDVEPSNDPSREVDMESSGVLITRMVTRPSPGGDAVAWWCFDTPEPIRGGLASGVRVDSAGRPSGAPCLSMRNSGRSGVHLSFEIPHDLPWSNLTLDLFHQSTARRYVPYVGEAFLSIQLDTWTPAERIFVAEQKGHHQLVVLPARLFREPGEHTISIRLHETSTTSYRLLSIALR